MHAGTSLQLCIETASRPCPTCSRLDWPRSKRCSTCGGRGQLVEYGWLLVRLEFDHFQERAVAYLPTAGTWDMSAEVREGALFRWPS